ncbi:50S ribosomal protein L15 [candidate division WOR-3 bacterium]|uniref:Large ribosomal subunit protein uL15 n=1 Tax=candidate division WOR-3 bacterium TaxID=2052148 RepID=A0A660SM65_UNCW3|nr:MAG: 50S ribosomal protein L15 [candidate division WOR-3 bacterium]
MRILSTLRPNPKAKKKRKRIGCGIGSGHGKTATRGHKGSGQRSGKEFTPAFEGGQMPLYRRIPKRGFTNIFKKEFEVVNIERLARFPPDSLIDPEVMKENGLIHGNLPVKILGRGEINIPIKVKAHAFSRSARVKIRAAGGSIEIINA